MASTKQVELTFPWTDRDNQEHKSGEVIELDDLEARKLIRAGRARDPKAHGPAPEVEHFDHVHLAKKDGDADPKLYDQGGWLPPGASVVANDSGRPEPVITALPDSDGPAPQTAPKKGR